MAVDDVPALRIFVSVLSLVLAWHCWTQGPNLRNIVPWSASFVRMHILGRGRPVETSDEEEALVLREMNQMRVNTSKRLMEFACPWLAVSLALGLVFSVAKCESGVPQDTGILLQGVFAYAFCYAFTKTSAQLTVRTIDIMNATFISAMISRTLSFRDSPEFFILGGARIQTRVSLGLLTMDYKKSFFWNFLVSVTVCLQNGVNLGSFCDGKLQPSHRDLVGLFEVYSLIILTILSVFMEKVIESHVRAKLHARSSHSSKAAVVNLLSVLCDAIVHLGPGLEIISPSRSLQHLLALPCADVEVGANVADYISLDDRSRFQELVGSDPQGDGKGVAPAKLIQLQMRNAAGLSFPVELFHVYFPDLDGAPGHLLGIRTVGTLLHEAMVPDAEEGGAPAAAATQDVAHAEQAPAVGGADAATFSPSLPAVPLAALQTSGAPPWLGEGSSSSSSSSTLSRSSAGGSALKRMPELVSTTLELDAGSPNLTIHQVNLKFASADDDPQVGDQFMPKLADWTPAESFIRFHEWLQTGLNAAQLAGGDSEDSEDDKNSLGLEKLEQMPLFSPTIGALRFVADTATLHPLEEDEDDDEALFLVHVEFEGFSLVCDRKPSSRRSKRSIRSHSRPIVTLPSINEVGDDSVGCVSRRVGRPFGDEACKEEEEEEQAGA